MPDYHPPVTYRGGWQHDRESSTAIQRSRGLDYYRRGAVGPLSVEPEGGDIVAAVEGTTTYLVRLDNTRRRALLGSCTCPYANSWDLPVCKHQFATYFAAVVQGMVAPLWGPLPAALQRTAAKPAFGAAPSLTTPPSPPALPPAFLSTLRQLAQRPVSRRAPVVATFGPGEIVYHLDVAGTQAGSGLVIEVLDARPPKRATSSREPKPIRALDSIEALGDPTDRALVLMLSGSTRWRGMREGIDLSTLSLSPLADAEIVPLLCATGRFRLRLGMTTGPPLAWDPRPWELRLHLAPGASGRVVLEGALHWNGERRPLAEPPLLTAGRHVYFNDQAAPLVDHGLFDWVTVLRHSPRVDIAAGAVDALARELAVLPGLPPLDVAPGTGLEVMRPAPRPELAITLRKGTGADGKVSFRYGDAEPVGISERGCGLWDPVRRHLLLRDREAETAATKRLQTLGAFVHTTGVTVQPQLVANATKKLVADGWRVTLDGKTHRTARSVSASVSTGIDWFDVTGEAVFDGASVPLPRLLAAIRDGEETLTFDDGTLGLIPEEWTARWRSVAKYLDVEKGRLRVGRTRSALLDALLAGREDVAVDEGFRQLRATLRRFERVQAQEPPRSFRGTLREYQKEGLGWFRLLRDCAFGGCLADDMGLGKTIQVLALLASRKEEAPGRTSIVVAPRSLLFNWREETRRFAPGLSILEHTGTGRPRDASGLAGVDLVLTTYGILRQDVVWLSEVGFDYVVLDEAQAVKNAGTDAAKAVRLLTGRHRLALSGTPIENRLDELFSLFGFLNPGLLGRHRSFLGGGKSEETRDLLRRALRPFLLRRTKEQVASDLPPKMEQTLWCELEPPQRRLYDELRAHYRASLLSPANAAGLKKAKIQVLAALLRLRQAACHPGLVDPERHAEPSAKLDALLPRLREVLAEGHKALVFSQFTTHLAILRSRLDAEEIGYEYLDGRVRDREARVSRFRTDPACGLFLISLKAGGFGLNLTEADYVFLLDPWWNPAAETQAIDRTHRIGQSRHVFAYRLIAKATIEEKIVALQAEKRALADAILGADYSLVRDLTREDLELLLS